MHCFTYELTSSISPFAQFTMDLFVKIMQQFMYEKKENDQATQTQLILKSHNLILDADTKLHSFNIFKWIINQQFNLDCYMPEIPDASLEPTLPWEEESLPNKKRKLNSELN